MTTTPSGWIVVSPRGDDTVAQAAPHSELSGAKAQPLATVQAAIRRSGPGAVVLVEAGVYRENVSIAQRETPDGWRGGLGAVTAKSPLLIVGADGFGEDGKPKARIVGADTTSTVFVNGISHVKLHNLWISGHGEANGEEDEAPIKFVGGGEALPPSKSAGWFTVSGCRVDGRGRDAMKVAKGRHLEVIGCHFDVTVPESMIDFVSVRESRVQNCLFLGQAKDGASAKAASGKILWEGNVFRYTGLYCCAIGWQDPAIMIGGIGWSRERRAMPPDHWNVECFDSVARRNLIAGAFEHAVILWGARDCRVEGNFVAHTGAPGRFVSPQFAWRSETAPSYPWRNQWQEHASEAHETWAQTREAHTPKLDQLGFAISAGNLIRGNVLSADRGFKTGFSKRSEDPANPNRIVDERRGTEAEWLASVGPIGPSAHDAQAIYRKLGLRD